MYQHQAGIIEKLLLTAFYVLKHEALISMLVSEIFSSNVQSDKMLIITWLCGFWWEMAQMFSIAVGLIRLHMPGIKLSHV